MFVEGGPVVSPRWVGKRLDHLQQQRQAGSSVRALLQRDEWLRVQCHPRRQLPVLFYDPAERVIATLHPNHTYEQVALRPPGYSQTTYDVNDTCAARNAQTGDPRTDPDISGYVKDYFKALPVDPTNPWQTWHAQRSGGALGPHEQAAATRAAAHADTPTTAHFDALGRPSSPSPATALSAPATPSTAPRRASPPALSST
jgi:hypothetical protein